MSVKLRLKRMGRSNLAFFRLNAIDSRSPRDGRFVAQVGTYDPAFDPPRVTIKKDVADQWIKAGAKPSDTVRKLIKRAETATVSA